MPGGGTPGTRELEKAAKAEGGKVAVPIPSLTNNSRADSRAEQQSRADFGYSSDFIVGGKGTAATIAPWIAAAAVAIVALAWLKKG